MIRILLAIWIGFLAGGVSPGAEEAVDIQQLVERVDELYRSSSSSARLEMEIVTPHWSRTLRMQFWTEGMDKTFIYLLAPKKDAGIATLRKGTEMWNYFPKINKVMKVPPSMMMGSWMGSDFTNDDLVKESSLMADYDAALGTSNRDDALRVVLRPRQETATVWGKIEILVRKTDWMPLEEVFFDEKGNRMRVMTFRDIRTFGGRPLPAVMEMRPLNKEAHRTVIRYLDAEFDRPLASGIFTLRNLRKQR